jgi:sugar (pentulose or hexulose) kinase
MLGGIAAGVYRDVADACAQVVRYSDVVTRPDAARVAHYDRLFERYARLYPALQAHFAEDGNGDDTG